MTAVDSAKIRSGGSQKMTGNKLSRRGTPVKIPDRAVAAAKMHYILDASGRRC
jgi:hypothetical protein